MRYFSPSKKGFYSDDVNEGSMPLDVIEISEDYYTSLLEGQSTGMAIVFGIDTVTLVTRESLMTIQEVKDAAIPKVLTPRQIRKVLTDSDLRTAVENMVATSTDYDLKDWWEYSLSYERTHPKLIEAAYALSLTDEQIDGMFILGATL